MKPNGRTLGDALQQPEVKNIPVSGDNILPLGANDENEFKDFVNGMTHKLKRNIDETKLGHWSHLTPGIDYNIVHPYDNEKCIPIHKTTFDGIENNC